MRTAEQRAPLVRAPPPRRGRGRRRPLYALALAAVLAGGLALRLWGVKQGLPYAYNSDEADHFVRHAIRMFDEGTLNPHYFANPPAFTYVLHFLFALWYGGAAGAHHAFALHPARVYELARVCAALLGALALWLLYATGARLFGRATGLLAAAIEAVAFLPVFYSHLALNDVPTLAPLTLSLLGSAGVLSKGRRRDFLVAGIGLGLACATKYTAGIAVLVLIAAAFARQREHPRERALASLALALAAALLVFVIANPYSVLDFEAFRRELARQSTLSAEAQGKLGAPRHGGLAYYLWSLTWGLGWAPALAALAGALGVWRTRPALGWLLVPAPLVFLAFMGLQGRYFGRWLMPIMPILSLLAAYATLRAAALLARLAPLRALASRGVPASRRMLVSPRVPRHALQGAFAALLAAGVLVQGTIHSVHAGLVLSRADTRNLTRAWMLANVPAGARIVAEPVSPDEWAREVRPGTSTAQNPYRWPKYPSLLARISPQGTLSDSTHAVGIEEYERTLSPALLDYYVRHGYCWIISGSTQSGRAYADPAAVPLAISYYRALARRGTVVFRASPYSRGAHAPPFGFDWSFDYYPLAYARPGPAITVYRLHGGRCGGPA